MAAVALPQQVGVGSFGSNQNGGDFGARNLIDSQRFMELDRRQSYYDCTQHDQKRFDFEGRVIQTGGGSATQPLLGGEKFPGYVPLKQRRPASPYRLARIIVSAFTNMLFGEHRFPTVKVDGDEDTQDFAQELMRECKLATQMIKARNIGGAVGTVGLSWCFIDGKPRVEVHNGKNLFVHEWLDREHLIPKHVSEVYLFAKDEWDETKKRYMKNWYWFRRDWTPNEDIVFEEVLYVQRREPVWVPCTDKSVIHNDNITHFEWVQNLPSESADGLPDYDGLYENFDAIDVIYSVIMRGAALNLDPTLKLKMDFDLVARMGVKKGSDHALVTGKDGDASYMELAGTSITAGLSLFDSVRRTVLEVAQCVVPDPAEVAAQGVSSVTIKALYATMLGKCDILREQYACAMQRILSAMTRVARDYMSGERTLTVIDKDGNEEQVPGKITLSPKVVKEPVLDADGNETQEMETKFVERQPGPTEAIDMRWGPYFVPTPADASAMATTLQIATGGKAFTSPQTATETMAVFLNTSPDEEWDRLQKTHATDEAQAGQMFADGAVGGQVTHETQLPSGAKVTRSAMVGPQPEDDKAAAPEKKPEVGLSPTDRAAIMTVNEARHGMGLPDWKDADGELTLQEFKEKHAETIAVAANAELGKTGTPPDADPPPPPMPPGFGAKGGPPGAGGKPPPFGGKGGPPGAGGAVPPPVKKPFGK